MFTRRSIVVVVAAASLRRPVSPLHFSTTTNRFPGPDLSRLTSKQQKIYDEIKSTRRGTGIKGPFRVWLANPEIADAAQKLGAICRYGTRLNKRDSEFVILITAKFHKSDTEWEIHLNEARDAGLEEDIIQAIWNCKDKQTLLHGLAANSRRDVALAEFCATLLQTSQVDNETYDRVKQEVEEELLVDVTSIVGYYTFVAYTLNVFDVKP